MIGFVEASPNLLRRRFNRPPTLKYPLLIQIWRQRDDRTILLDRESLFEIVRFTLEILLISTLIRTCVLCRKLRGKVEVQKMSDLPEDRLTPGPPFSAVGVDTFGPWNVTIRHDPT
jgi:hypothetical protein